MDQSDFIIKEYEIISQRRASADSYSGAFVSIYFVFQAALFTANAIGSRVDQTYYGSWLQIGSWRVFINFFSLLGILTTIWAIFIVVGYLYSIKVMEERMIDIEKYFFADAHAEVFASRMYARPYRRLLHTLLVASTSLVLSTFLVAWLFIAFRV